MFAQTALGVDGRVYVSVYVGVLVCRSTGPLRPVFIVFPPPSAVHASVAVNGNVTHPLCSPEQSEMHLNQSSHNSLPATMRVSFSKPLNFNHLQTA